jgi:hypothetical protein
MFYFLLVAPYFYGILPQKTPKDFKGLSIYLAALRPNKNMILYMGKMRGQKLPPHATRI